ncbi:glutaminyl-tRNA synthetase [Nonlabens sp. MIC269]|uniref:DUF6327 family protein n=1 Tax=Nonlabens TaxID=363408 RepID=UPI00071F1981|nr:MULTISPECIES: DUF6327 family protein [Nonlabens]ALM21083.1 glutaminyl-tRNA synthetase [Nonlabens sp. MIC269]ARN72197.1 hypothetical protein BST91_11275 [Nonlabens tegetincola]MEE2801385.1 DUF6327 family protein [Bacteroidota bacterium]PQJ20186.1 hypothetical protein BST93_01730 [Nonlabens tegetincola]
MKVYNNFDEINKELNVLSLQKQIHEETMKLKINEVKEELSAVSIVTNMISSIAKKAVVLKIVNKFLSR